MPIRRCAWRETGNPRQEKCHEDRRGRRTARVALLRRWSDPSDWPGGSLPWRSFILGKILPSRLFQKSDGGSVRRASEEISEGDCDRAKTQDCLGIWCRRGDSNPHGLPHTPLKRARLPIPPLRRSKQKVCRRPVSLSMTREAPLANGRGAGSVPRVTGAAADPARRGCPPP